MTNRGKKASRRRNLHRTPFGQITYMMEGYHYTGQRVGNYDYTKRIQLIKRMFKTYEDAVLHLTNVELGLTVDDYPWRTYKPHKLISGYRLRDKKHIVSVKVINELPKPKEKIDECSSVGRQIAGLRQSRQLGKSFIPLSQDLGTTTDGNGDEISTISWSGGTATYNHTASEVEPYLLQPRTRTISANWTWDTLPIGAFV